MLLLVMLGFLPAVSAQSRPESRRWDSEWIQIDLEFPRCDQGFDSSRDDLLQHVTLRPRIPGSSRIRYRGFESVVVRYLKRRLQREWSRSLSRYGDLHNLSLTERQRLGRRRADAFRDLREGRWWERRWFHSLTPELGGAPLRPWVHQIGRRLVILDWGEFTLTNEFRGRLNGFLLSAREPRNRIPSRSPESWEWAGRPVDGRLIAPVETEGERPPGAFDLWIGLDTRPWFAYGLRWELKVRPGSHWRFKPDQVRADLHLRAVLRLTVVPSERRVADIEWLGRYRLWEDEWSLELQAVLLRW
jgi:hypothetical protein